MTHVKKAHKRHPKEHLSADELKAKLYTHFHRTGVLDDFRTKIRNKLVTEIFKVSQPHESPEKFSPNYELQKTLLPLQVSNWLVYDHLKRQKHEYSLSTFVTEAKLSYPDQLLSVKDVLNLLGITNSTPEFNEICSRYIENTSESFLNSLLSSIIKYHTNHDKLHENEKAKSTFDAKQKNGESGRLTSSGDVLGKLNHEILTELRPSKVFENISHKRHKEDENIDMINQHHLQLEKEKYENEIRKLRQKLIEELDNIYAHEQETQLELEQKKKKLNKEFELLENKKDELKKREKELMMKSESMEKEIENRIMIEKEKLSSMHMTENAKIKELEAALKEKEHWFENEQASFLSQQNEVKALKIKTGLLEDKIKLAQSDNADLTEKNYILQKKIEDMGDYLEVKETLKTKMKELDKSKKEIREIKLEADEEKQKLQNRIQVLQLQLNDNSKDETRQNQISTSHVQELLWNQQRERLEKELTDFKSIYQKLLHRMEEQNDDIQELHKTIHILHYQLSQKMSPTTTSCKQQQTVNEQPLLASSKLSQHREYFGKEPYLPTLPSRKLYYAPEMTTPVLNMRLCSKYQRDPLEFIAEAKRKVEALEKEAHNLEQKYNFFLATEPKLFSSKYFPFKRSDLFQNEIRSHSTPYENNINFNSISKDFGSHLILDKNTSLQSTFMSPYNANFNLTVDPKPTYSRHLTSASRSVIQTEKPFMLKENAQEHLKGNSEISDAITTHENPYSYTNNQQLVGQSIFTASSIALPKQDKQHVLSKPEDINKGTSQYSGKVINNYLTDTTGNVQSILYIPENTNIINKDSINVKAMEYEKTESQNIGETGSSNENISKLPFCGDKSLTTENYEKETYSFAHSGSFHPTNSISQQNLKTANSSKLIYNQENLNSPKILHHIKESIPCEEINGSTKLNSTEKHNLEIFMCNTTVDCTAENHTLKQTEISSTCENQGIDNGKSKPTIAYNKENVPLCPENGSKIAAFDSTNTSMNKDEATYSKEVSENKNTAQEKGRRLSVDLDAVWKQKPKTNLLSSTLSNYTIKNDDTVNTSLMKTHIPENSSIINLETKRIKDDKEKTTHHHSFSIQFEETAKQHQIDSVADVCSEIISNKENKCIESISVMNENSSKQRPTADSECGNIEVTAAISANINKTITVSKSTVEPTEGNQYPSEERNSESELSEKQTNKSTISELSELHLSVGSDVEQSKTEESDW